MNRVDLTGRLTADPEVRVTSGGVSVCVFSIGCRRTYKNAKGEYDTDFIRCVAYRYHADFLGKFAHKGDLLEVGGAVRQYKYDGNDGKRHTGLEVVVDSSGNVGILARKQTGNYSNVGPNDGFDEVEPPDDDLPF